jgi:autotransporter-associated beta strand protein
VNTLNGSGDLFLMTVNNDLAADSGSGVRFRGTAASGFSGIITVSNNVKTELQTTAAGPFSPVGTGRIKLVCGSIFATNNTQGPPIGGYCELNLRNNGSGDTIFTNDVELVGSGIALADPLGTAPAGTKIIMGQLKIGGGQELGVYLSAAPSHNLVFPRVLLTGGTARFSPKTPGFGATTSAGSDLSLGDISETGPSGFIMNGISNLFLIGTNTYSGATTVSNGFLIVNGSNGPSALTVYGGTLGGTGVISGPVEIASSGALAPGSSIGTLAISNTLTVDAGGTTTMEINAGSVTSDQVVGLTSVTYGGTLNVVNLGGTLAANQTYKLFDAGSYSGTFATTNLPALGTGLAWDVSGLNNNGTIKIVATVNLNPTNITVAISGNQLTLSWPPDHLGWTLQTNVSSILDTNWFAVPGSESSTQAVITIDPVVPNVFYRLVHAVP